MSMIKNLIFASLFITSAAQASYYCSFTCMKANPYYDLITAIAQAPRAAFLADSVEAVSGVGPTDYDAYRDAWKQCKSGKAGGTFYLMVTNTVVLKNDLVYGGLDASPRYCQKARD